MIFIDEEKRVYKLVSNVFAILSNITLDLPEILFCREYLNEDDLNKKKNKVVENINDFGWLIV